MIPNMNLKASSYGSSMLMLSSGNKKKDKTREIEIDEPTFGAVNYSAMRSSSTPSSVVAILVLDIDES